MHLGRFPDSVEFQSWRVNLKTEVCAQSALLHITVHWIKEVEIAGRTDFTDCGMLDAMIASALTQVLTHVHFRKKEVSLTKTTESYEEGRLLTYI